MKKSLIEKKCLPCEGKISALSEENSRTLLQQLNQWTMHKDNKAIYKEFSFKNFYSTMSFVNAIAWIANVENHHPTLKVQYSSCRVEFSTHTVGGLTENDFICAAKVDALLAL